NSPLLPLVSGPSSASKIGATWTPRSGPLPCPLSLFPPGSAPSFAATVDAPGRLALISTITTTTTTTASAPTPRPTHNRGLGPWLLRFFFLRRGAAPASSGSGTRTEAPHSGHLTLRPALPAGALTDRSHSGQV